MHALDAIDARTITHIPTSFPSGPYMVVRDRQVLNFESALVSRLVILGPHRANAPFFDGGDNLTRIIGRECLGQIGKKPSDMAFIFAKNLDPFVPFSQSKGANVSLHALTATVSCTSAALAAEGVSYMGTLRGTCHPNDYQIVADGIITMINDLTTRPEMTTRSSYSLCSRMQQVFTAPLDHTQHSMFHRLVDNPASPNDTTLTDALMPMAIVLAPGNTYAVTIYSEWRVIAHASPTFASLHTSHPPAPRNFWQRVGDMVSENAGLLGNMAGQALQTAGRFAEGFMGAQTYNSPYVALSTGRRGPLMLPAP